MPTIEYLRSFRIGGYAIFDFTLAFLGIYILSPVLTRLLRPLRLDVPRSSWIFLTLPIGILVHVLVGTNTPLTKAFLDPTRSYVLKLVIVALFLCGIRRIKRIGTRK